jgi:TRAP-type uncharacterized transport system fused permease subunit
VPFIVVLSDPGTGLLLEGGWQPVLLASVISVGSVSALSVATGAWLLGPAGWVERILLGVGAIALLVMEPIYMGVGALAVISGLLIHLAGRWRRRSEPPAATIESQYQ